MRSGSQCRAEKTPRVRDVSIFDLSLALKLAFHREVSKQRPPANVCRIVALMLRQLSQQLGFGQLMGMMRTYQYETVV